MDMTKKLHAAINGSIAVAWSEFFLLIGYVNIALFELVVSAIALGAAISLERKQLEEQDIDLVMESQPQSDKKLSFNQNQEKQKFAYNKTPNNRVDQVIPTFDMDDTVVEFFKSTDSVSKTSSTVQKTNDNDFSKDMNFDFNDFDELDETVLSFFAEENKKTR